MEDAHLIVEHLSCPNSNGLETASSSGRALFAVFDGHNGRGAADFLSENLLAFMQSSEEYPHDIKTCLFKAFLHADCELYQATRHHQEYESGTTALAVVVWDNQLILANAGDSRAVLSQRGRAKQLTVDHRPLQSDESERLKACGGYVCREGLLGGELSVSRALGDFHLVDLKDPHQPGKPLIAEPQVAEHDLQEGDEFLILGCDGLWDVLSSENAVEYARKQLQEHNDPKRCSEALVQRAIELHSGDNLTVITICFANEAPRRKKYERTLSRDALNILALAMSNRGQDI